MRSKQWHRHFLLEACQTRMLGTFPEQIMGHRRRPANCPRHLLKSREQPQVIDFLACAGISGGDGDGTVLGGGGRESLVEY